ncbi:unnamed protein product [Boreogadus saida]
MRWLRNLKYYCSPPSSLGARLQGPGCPPVARRSTEQLFLEARYRLRDSIILVKYLLRFLGLSSFCHRDSKPAVTATNLAYDLFYKSNLDQTSGGGVPGLPMSRGSTGSLFRQHTLGEHLWNQTVTVLDWRHGRLTSELTSRGPFKEAFFSELPRKGPLLRHRAASFPPILPQHVFEQARTLTISAAAAGQWETGRGTSFIPAEQYNTNHSQLCTSNLLNIDPPSSCPCPASPRWPRTTSQPRRNERTRSNSFQRTGSFGKSIIGRPKASRVARRRLRASLSWLGQEGQDQTQNKPLKPAAMDLIPRLSHAVTDIGWSTARYRACQPSHTSQSSSGRCLYGASAGPGGGEVRSGKPGRSGCSSGFKVRPNPLSRGRLKREAWTPLCAVSASQPTPSVRLAVWWSDTLAWRKTSLEGVSTSPCASQWLCLATGVE